MYGPPIYGPKLTGSTTGPGSVGITDFTLVPGTMVYTDINLNGAAIKGVFYGAQRLEATQYSLSGSDLTLTFDPAAENLLVIYTPAVASVQVDEFTTVAAQGTYTRSALNGKTIEGVWYGAQRLEASQYGLSGSDFTLNFTEAVESVMILYTD